MVNFEGLFERCEYDSILKLHPKSVYDTVIYMRSAILLEKWDKIRPFLDSALLDSVNPSYLPYILQYLINSPYNGKGSTFFKKAISIYKGVEDYIYYMWGLFYLENNKIDSAIYLLPSLRAYNSVLFKKLAREITSRLMQYKEYKKYISMKKRFLLTGPYFQYAYILSLKGTGKPYRPLLYQYLKKYPRSPYTKPLIRYLDTYTPRFIPALYHAKKYQKVIYLFEHYHPDNDKYLALYIKSLYRKRRYKKLEKAIKKYAKRLKNIDDPELFLMAGIAFIRHKKIDKGLSMFLAGSVQSDDIKNVTEFFYTLFRYPEKDKKWRKTLLSYRESFDGFTINFYSGLYFLVMGDTQNAQHFLERALYFAEEPTRAIKAQYYLKKITDTISIEDSMYLTYYNARSGAIKIDGYGSLVTLLNNYYSDYPLAQNSTLFRWKLLYMLGGYLTVRREAGKNPRSMLLAAKMAEKEGLLGESIYYAVKLLPYIRGVSDTTGFPLEFLKMYFPLTYLPKIEKYSAIFGFDPLLFLSLTREESWFYNKAISPAGAIGLCQLMPYTAKKLAGDSIDVSTISLFNPDINIRLGSFYFTALLDSLGSVPLALAGYNAGPKRAKKWQSILSKYINDIDIFIEFIPITETRGYVKRILRTRRIYGRLISMGVRP